MPIATLDTSFHALELEPHVLLEVESVQVIQCLGPVPATEDVHQRLVHYCRVSEADVWLADEGHVVEHGRGTFLLVRQHDAVHHVATRITVMKDLAPSVGQYLVLMDVFKDLNLVSAAVNVEAVLVAHKGVIGARLRQHTDRVMLLALLGAHGTIQLATRVRVHLPLAVRGRHAADVGYSHVGPDLEPLALLHLVLEQIVEVRAAFTRVSTEKEQAVAIRYGSRARPGLRLAARLSLTSTAAAERRRLL